MMCLFTTGLDGGVRGGNKRTGCRCVQVVVAYLAMSVMDEDPLVSVLPIHYSNAVVPNVQMHQFPLLTRPLQLPPWITQSGKKIRARIKPKAGRIEVHVPVDTRPEVWNVERGKELGQARAEDDQEKSLELKKSKLKETEDLRLSEIRMRSEQVPSRGAYMLGVVRDGVFLLLLIISGLWLSVD